MTDKEKQKAKEAKAETLRLKKISDQKIKDQAIALKDAADREKDLKETLKALIEQSKVIVEKPVVKTPVIKETGKNLDSAPLWEIKDRTYVLCTRKTPIMMTVPVKHTGKRPLLWFDEALGYERELRYATNQKSVFVDEQEGHVTLEHVAIRDGALTVPKNKQNLQKLLSLYHPLKNVIYREVDDVAVAGDDLDIMDLELEALNAAANMDIDLAEAIMRVEIGNGVSELSSKELKRDIRQFAKRNPKVFLELANDDNIAVRNVGIKAVEAGLLKLASDQRTFLWGSTGRKIMTVPFDENPYSALAAFFKTDDGVEIYRTIEKRLG